MQRKYWDNPRSLKDPLDEIDLETRKLMDDLRGLNAVDECFGKYGTGWVWDNPDGSAMTLEEAVEFAKKEMGGFEIT